MAAKKPYAIKYEAPDGKSVKKFATLAEAGKYLFERYAGYDYLRGASVMGTDYAVFTLVGFDLEDIGEFYSVDGFGAFEFYDWAGGEVVDLSQGDYHVVAIVDGGEHDHATMVVSAHATLDEAIAAAIAASKLGDHDAYEVVNGGDLMGYVDNGNGGHAFVSKSQHDAVNAAIAAEAMAELAWQEPPF